ncbi:hypothetical protein IMSAG192_01638 [Muribaculaceae bacterium]|nr:hypothetical protein IMSAG192_01638 [Muribaculaceae bacterium]
MIAVDIYPAAPCAYRDIRRLAGLAAFEVYVIDSRLVAYCIMNMHRIISGRCGYIHREFIWSEILVVVAVLLHGRHGPVMPGIDSECRALTMVCDYHRKSVEQPAGIVGSLRIYPQHAVGELHGRKSRHKQMTDIADIRVDIIYRLSIVSRVGIDTCMEYGCPGQ